MAGFIFAQKAKESERLNGGQIEAGRDVLGDGLDGLLVRDGEGTEQIRIGQGATGGNFSVDESGTIQEARESQSKFINATTYEGSIVKYAGNTHEDVADLMNQTNKFIKVLDGIDIEIPDGKNWIVKTYATDSYIGNAPSAITDIDWWAFRMTGHLKVGATPYGYLGPGSYTDVDVILYNYGSIEDVDDTEMTFHVSLYWEIVEVPAW